MPEKTVYGELEYMMGRRLYDLGGNVENAVRTAEAIHRGHNLLAAAMNAYHLETSAHEYTPGIFSNVDRNLFRGAPKPAQHIFEEFLEEVYQSGRDEAATHGKYNVQ